MGKYRRRRPLVFSFVPRCHGLWGSAKKTFTPDSIVYRAWSDSSLPQSQVKPDFVAVAFAFGLSTMTALWIAKKRHV
jgi:hypothetical protein